MSVKIIGTLPKQEPTNNYNQAIKPKFADKTKQTNQAISRLVVSFGGDDETKPTKKTADDFLKKVVAEQPIKINDNNAKKETIAMKASKSADKMTKEDYNMSFRRAVYNKVMVGVKLTDEEIKLADQTLKNANLYSSDYDLKSSAENLQEAQKKSGNIIPVKVGRENLERAKIAGQAVLQYQEYKSKEADVNKANADKEVNEMFADQARVLWNSGVNIVEGTINTGIDAALSDGGRKPLVLTNPFRPQVDFSGAKLDYQSRMMRRDINGKVDGEGLKRGDFTEMGVTILAPLVIGNVAAPFKAPQTLEKLGAFPNLVVKESKFNYFFNKDIKPDPHNVPRAVQNETNLRQLGIVDNAEGKKKLFDIFDQGLKNPTVGKPHISKFGITVTKHVKVSEVGGIDVKYFYPNRVMNAKPQITSITPKIYKTGK